MDYYKYVLLIFPLGVNLLKANTVHMCIDALIGYPIGIVAFGIYGGLFGFGVGMHKHHDEILPKLPDYVISVISASTDELYSYVKIKFDEISKRLP